MRFAAFRRCAAYPSLSTIHGAGTLLYKYSLKKALFLLFVTFILFGLLEAAHQRNMRWYTPNSPNSLLQ